MTEAFCGFPQTLQTNAGIVQQTLANPVTVNPDRNMKNAEECRLLGCGAV
jgi:hypothetical protein